MPSQNYYQVLNVAKDADVATIQKAFRVLSLKMHPDKANAATAPTDRTETKEEREAREKRNHEKFVELNEARSTLTNAEKRQEYDEELEYRSRGPSHNTYHNTSSQTSGHTSKAGPSRNRRPSRGSSHHERPRRGSTYSSQNTSRAGPSGSRHSCHSSSHHDRPRHGSTFPEGRHPPRSAARHDTEDGYIEMSRNLNRLVRDMNRLCDDMDRMCAEFSGMAPLSRATAAYEVYSEVLSLFEHAILITTWHVSRLSELDEGLRHREPRAWNAWDPIMMDAIDHKVVLLELAYRQI
ncbi:DnaJ domain-containing protein [Xylaria palmicola]|nr:DnaJ domain-containing protein [Xylaria palmicola]